MGIYRVTKNKIKKSYSRFLYLLKTFIFGKKECTRETERCKYHSKCCTRNLEIILEYVDSLFKEINIKYWLDYGTLLGAVREGQLIEYDTDIDLGILESDRGKLISLEDRIENDGFYLNKDKKLDFYRIALSKINTLHADIFFWKKREDGTLYREEYMKKDENKGRDFNEISIRELETRNINNKPYPVPSDPEDFCRFRFGSNWKEKIKYSE